MRNGFFPSSRVFFLLFVPFILVILSFWISGTLVYSLAADGIILLGLGLDLIISPNYRKDLELKLEIPKLASVHTFSDCTLKVANRNSLPVKFKFLLDLDVSFNRDYASKLYNIRPKETLDCRFQLYAGRRGDYKLKEIYLKGRSILGLWNLYRKFPLEEDFRVIPAVYRDQRQFKLIQKHIRYTEGSQKNRRIGDGTNFEMLRDYLKGDEYSRIDWKATARKGKPITRVYRMENNFSIFLLLDCGRILSSEAGGTSLLDKAVDASLVLAYAAAKSHDSVSCLAFGREIIRYMPPTRDMKTVRKLGSVLSDIQYELAEPNYQKAFSFIQTQLTKRSLVILFTDFIDDSNIPVFRKNLGALQKNHQVLMLLLKDPQLFETAEKSLSEKHSLYDRTAAYDLILRRTKALAGLKRLGIQVLDVYPNQVSSELISKYFEIRNRI